MTVLVKPLRNTMSEIEGLKRVTGKNHGSVITGGLLLRSTTRLAASKATRLATITNKQA